MIARIFDRMIGQETEYAIRFHPRAAKPGDQFLFRRLVGVLRETIPVLPAEEVIAHSKEGVFTAYGGAVWFEKYRQASRDGLIEGATPECRSPRELLAYQRAQDRLLADAAARSEPDAEFRLVKNCRDSRGRAYGTHENYEVDVGHGTHLILWRAGLVLAAPLMLLFWTITLPLVVLTVLPLIVLSTAKSQAGQTPAERNRPLDDPPVTVPPGSPVTATEDPFVAPWSERVEPGIMGGFFLFFAPVMWAVTTLARWTIMRRISAGLIPFLVTRPILTGSGWVSEQGEFHIAQKAPSLNRQFGNYAIWDRPIFNFANLSEAVLLFPFKPNLYRRAFRTRHRLQVGLGDSNMAQEAEYLKFATTELVLDAVQAGAIRAVPRVRNPVATLHRLCRDPELREPVRLSNGQRRSAIDVQRYYLEACRTFVESCEDAPDEARDVLARWDESLRCLESDRQQLVGRIDWITKQFLLDTAGDDLDIDARRKLDIRYHELAPEGYFARLDSTGTCPPVLTDEELDRAMRLPPASTRAATRGRYVREFATGDAAVVVNWDWVRVRDSPVTRLISLVPDDAET